MNNKEFSRKRINSSKRNYNIKSLNILTYSDCVKFYLKRNVSSNVDKNINAKNKRKNLNLKLDNEFEEKKKQKNDIYHDEKHLNIYSNKNFKDTLSSFLYHVNNITEYQNENKKSIDDYSSDKMNNKLYNNELIRHISKDKFNINNTNNAKVIKRFEVDISNIFLIQRPLITTIRGKILKNTKKRFKRPIRNIIKSNIFYNYKE